MRARIIQTVICVTSLSLLTGFGSVAVAQDVDATSGATTHTAPYGETEFSIDNAFAPASGLAKFADELGLTLEQRDRIKLMMYETEPRIKQLRVDIQALRTRMMSATPDDPEFQTVTAETSQAAALIAAELVNLTAEIRVKTHGLLTDEQKTRLKTLIQEKKAEHQSHSETESAAPE
jgi:Spy/CpxP family protein refolding chaperone